MTRPALARVAVIGGGPAGASAALELARRGIETIVLERSGGGGNPIGESLAPSSNPLLHRLGLADVLLATGAWPCHGNRSSWGGDGALVDHDFLREPFGHGWHLDRPAFNAALLAAAAAAGASVRLRTRAVSFERSGGRWRIVTERGGDTEPIVADLLVDATGRAATVARRLGARRRAFDSLVAVVAVLGSAERRLRDSTTLVEAAAEGWWYSVLLPDGRLVVAWFTVPDLLARRQAWRAAGWWDLLAASGATRERVAIQEGRPPETARLVAAGSTLLARPGGDGWIAAGDAAAAFDPLSSHGIGSALAGGKRAASAVVAAALGGDEAALAAYAGRVVADYAYYLVTRHAYYAAEQRWPAAPFWSRRHSGAGVRVRVLGRADP